MSFKNIFYNSVTEKTGEFSRLSQLINKVAIFGINHKYFVIWFKLCKYKNTGTVLGKVQGRLDNDLISNHHLEDYFFF